MRIGPLALTVGMLATLEPLPGHGQVLQVPPGRWWERPRVAEELVLTAEQREQLEAASLSHARELVDLKAAVEKAEIDLRAAADREPFDAKAVRSAFAALQQARMRMETHRFEMLLAVRQVLTARQWERLKELTREWVREGERGKDIRDGMGPRSLRPRL